MYVYVNHEPEIVCLKEGKCVCVCACVCVCVCLRGRTREISAFKHALSLSSVDRELHDARVSVVCCSVLQCVAVCCSVVNEISAFKCTLSLSLSNTHSLSIALSYVCNPSLSLSETHTHTHTHILNRRVEYTRCTSAAMCSRGG